MCIIKFCNQRVEGRRLESVINYATNPDAIRGTPVVAYKAHPHMLHQSFNIIKELFRKFGGREYVHIVVSFDKKERVTSQQIPKLVRGIIKEFFPDFQSLCATHLNTKNLHCHVVINSVSCEDGRKFQFSKKDLKKFKSFVHQRLVNDGITDEVEVYFSEEDSLEILNTDDKIYDFEILDIFDDELDETTDFFDENDSKMIQIEQELQHGMTMAEILAESIKNEQSIPEVVIELFCKQFFEGWELGVSDEVFQILGDNCEILPGEYAWRLADIVAEQQYWRRQIEQPDYEYEIEEACIDAQDFSEDVIDDDFASWIQILDFGGNPEAIKGLSDGEIQNLKMACEKREVSYALDLLEYESEHRHWEHEVEEAEKHSFFNRKDGE